MPNVQCTLYIVQSIIIPIHEIVMMFQYEEEYCLALDLVKEASNIFLPAFYSPKHVETKSSATDLVTGTSLS